MNARKLLALASAFLFVVAGLTSCNKDNFGKDADKKLGKYEISDASSPIKSIELTRDGEYIITKNPAFTKSNDDLDLDDVWLYGNFTFVDGAYVLQGFGKIVIDLLRGGAAEIFRKGANIALIAERNKLDRAYYIGDIQGDYDATMEAGFDFIHAAYGFGRIKEKVPELKRFSDLPVLLDTL